MGSVRIFAAAAVSFILALCGDAAAEDGRWTRAETPHFIVYSDLGNRVRASAAQLEHFDAWLRFLLGVHTEPANKLEVYLFGGENGLSLVWPGVSSDVRGFYEATPEQTAAFALYRTSGFGDQTVLFHEYAHHFMLQYFAGAYPKWFVEGFAEFVSTTTFDRNEAYVGASTPARVRQLNQDAWMPLDRMLKGDIRGDDIFRFYAQSWLMTHYVWLDQTKKAAFARYVAALRAGGDPIASFQPAFGETLDQFDTDLRHHLDAGITRYGVPFPQKDEPTITVTALPRSADALLPILARLRRPPTDPDDHDDHDDLTHLAQDAITAAAHYPDNPMAQRVHAWGLLLNGDRTGARAILEPRIGADPNDAEALYLLGKSYLDEAKTGPPEAYLATAARGRPYFARVFHLNPHHAATLYDYSQTFGHPLDEQTLEVLVQAHDLAPQVEEISVYTGIALMEDRRFLEAIPMLASVAYSPHGSHLAKRALQLLDAAQHGQPPPPPAPDTDSDDHHHH